jgi:subtilisin-like proprotein convertase family protein
MRSSRSRLAVLGILALALGVIAGPTAGAAQAKKKKVGGTVDITKQVNAPIPDATTGPPGTNGLLTSTITVGKKFKGSVIRDVNVTVQTTGNNATAAQDLNARLTAPNGATSWLFRSLSGQSIGPLTLDDQSSNFLALGTTTNTPDQLGPPYAGTAQPDLWQHFGGSPLTGLNNGPANGTWTLRVYDTGTTAGRTSTLNLWRLHVLAGKPYLTK